MVDVTVIIPTYNRLWSLPDAIKSCRNTTCNTEIIVVDDGSKDGTSKWLEDQTDVKVIRQSNQGKPMAVNQGFTHALGKYVRFLDSDDSLSRNAMDEQFVIAEQNQSDIVVSGHLIADEHLNIIGKRPWMPCDDFISQQLGECDSSHYSAYLFLKKFIEAIPHRSEFNFRDDRLFILEAALRNPTVSIHNSFSLIHRIHKNNRLQFPDGINLYVQHYQHVNIYKKILGELQASGELNERRINAAINILWPLAHWIAKSDLQEGIKTVRWIQHLNEKFSVPNKGILGSMYRYLGFNLTERILKVRRNLIGDNQ